MLGGEKPKGVKILVFAFFNWENLYTRHNIVHRNGKKDNEEGIIDEKMVSEAIKNIEKFIEDVDKKCVEAMKVEVPLPLLF